MQASSAGRVKVLRATQQAIKKKRERREEKRREERETHTKEDTDNFFFAKRQKSYQRQRERETKRERERVREKTSSSPKTSERVVIVGRRRSPRREEAFLDKTLFPSRTTTRILKKN